MSCFCRVVDGGHLLMSVRVLEFTVLFLLVVTALTLFLVLRLAAQVRALEGASLVTGLQVGEVIPDFEGRRALDGAPITSADLVGRNTALVFLSSGCPECLAKRAELLTALPGMDRAEVTF